MKIEYTNGCIADRITIDGEDFSDLSAWKLGVLKDKIVVFLKATELSEVNLQDLVIWITERCGTRQDVQNRSTKTLFPTFLRRTKC